MMRSILAAGVCAALISCGPAKNAAEKPSEPPAAPETASETPSAPESADAPTDADVEETVAPRFTAPQGCETVTNEGYCGVRFNMTGEEASAAYPGGLYDPYDAAKDPDYASCYYLQTSKDNFDVGFMVYEGKVERIDVASASPATAAGAKNGMRFADVAALYPGAKRQPNKYMAPLEDLIVDFGSGAKAVFEQNEGGDVYAWRIGREPAVMLVEGCS